MMSSPSNTGEDQNSNITDMLELSIAKLFDRFPLSLMLTLDGSTRACWGGHFKSSSSLINRKTLIIAPNAEELEKLELPPLSDARLLRWITEDRKEDHALPESYRALRLGLATHALLYPNPNQFDQLLVAKLQSHLPSLTTLRLVFEDKQHSADFGRLLGPVSSLLAAYTHQLTELTLKVSWNEAAETEAEAEAAEVKTKYPEKGVIEAQIAANCAAFRRLCTALANLKSLTCLELRLTCSFAYCWRTPWLPLTELSQSGGLSALLANGRLESLHLDLDLFEEYPKKVLRRLIAGAASQGSLERLKLFSCAQLYEDNSLEVLTKDAAKAIGESGNQQAAATFQLALTRVRIMNTLNLNAPIIAEDESEHLPKNSKLSNAKIDHLLGLLGQPGLTPRQIDQITERLHLEDCKDEGYMPPKKDSASTDVGRLRRLLLRHPNLAELELLLRDTPSSLVQLARVMTSVQGRSPESPVFLSIASSFGGAQLSQEKPCELPQLAASAADQLSIPELPSVKALHLQGLNEMRSHQEFFEDGMHLSSVFPNLQVLQLEQWYECCSACNYDLSSSRLPRGIGSEETLSMLSRAVDVCLRRSRVAFFGRCPRLTRLVVRYQCGALGFSLPLDRVWRDYTREGLMQEEEDFLGLASAAKTGGNQV